MIGVAGKRIVKYNHVLHRETISISVGLLEVVVGLNRHVRFGVALIADKPCF